MIELLIKFGFKPTSIEYQLKHPILNKTAIVFRCLNKVSITNYTPKYHRFLDSETIDSAELKNRLEKSIPDYARHTYNT